MSKKMRIFAAKDTSQHRQRLEMTNLNRVAIETRLKWIMMEEDVVGILRQNCNGKLFIRQSRSNTVTRIQ